MPIPLLVVGGVTALGAAFGVGRYSRQGEINELKEKIIELQEQIEVLQNLVSKQNDTIRQLKAENKSLNALHFMEKKKIHGRTKGLIIFQYAFKEYLQLVRLDANEELLSGSSEFTLFNILDRMFYNKDVSLEEKGIIKVYIEGKYAYEVKNLIPIEVDAIEQALEEKYAG